MNCTTSWISFIVTIPASFVCLCCRGLWLPLHSTCSWPWWLCSASSPWCGGRGRSFGRSLHHCDGTVCMTCLSPSHGVRISPQEKQPAITWPITTKSSSSWVSSAIWQHTERNCSTVMVVQHGLRFGPKSHLQLFCANCWMSRSSASSSSCWSTGTVSLSSWPRATLACTISAAVVALPALPRHLHHSLLTNRQLVDPDSAAPPQVDQS